MAEMLELGNLVVATDATMAFEINRPSRSRSAVDSRVRGVAAEVISSDPTIKDAAAAALGDAASDAGFLKQQEVGAVRTLKGDHPVYADVKLSYDYRVVSGLLRSGGEAGVSGPGYQDVVLNTGAGTVTVTRDYRRAQPGSDPNGLIPQRVMETITRAVLGTKLASISGWGDSMTRDNGGLGTSFIRELGGFLDVPYFDRAFSGDTPQQVATRMGAFAARVTIADDVLPQSGPVSVTVSPERGWRGTRTWNGTMRAQDGAIVNVTLVQDGTNQDGIPSWTLEQRDGLADVVVLPGTRFRHPHAADKVAVASPMTLWVGRNDVNVDRGRVAVKAVLDQLQDPAGRVLVLPVFNRSTEPSGSAGHAAVLDFNSMLAEVAGARFFDARSLFVTHGLGVAGIEPTSDDVAAIAADCVPPSLLADDTHFNVAGRVAFARIVANEILGRNW